MTMKSLNVVLQPNSHMRKLIQAQCDYRRYCWNQALSYWNDLYDFYSASQINDLDKKIMTKSDLVQFEMNKEELQAFKKAYYPTERKVRDYLVAHKADWERIYSSRILQLAVKDLKIAFQGLFDKSRPDAKHPNFHSKKIAKMSFKTDSARIINGKLRLDKAHGYQDAFYDIRINKHQLKKFNGQLKLVNIAIVNHQYIATLFYDDSENQVVNYTNKTTAIDINVGHLNYTNGVLNVLTNRINKLYKTNEKYHKLLACKRNIYKKHLKRAAKANNKISSDYHPSHSYNVVLNKLRLNYQKIVNLQNEIYHKFTKFLVENYDWITIEDLDVKAMKMGFASKGIHKTGFAKLRRLLEYKCEWYGKHLIIANRYYPSTQICSMCGFRKTGDDKITLFGNKKHKTKHEQYICYACGFKCDRDINAVNNLEHLSTKVKEKYLNHADDLTLNGRVTSITNV